MGRQRHVPTALTPGKRQPLYRGVLDECVRSRLHRDSIPGPSSPWPVAVQTKLFWPTQLPFCSVCLYQLKTPYAKNYGLQAYETR
jgi:hypothetical protein